MDAMPKFSIKDLLIATAVIAVGLGIAMSVFTFEGQYHGRTYIPISLWLAGGTLVGIGLAWPFQRPWFWAFAVLFTATALTLLFNLMVFRAGPW